MDVSTLVKPAIGAGLIYAADNVKAIPAWLRVPLVVVGTLMVARALPVVKDQI